LQIDGKGQKVLVRSGAKVSVREHRDGSVTVWLNKTKLQWHELTERPKKARPAPKTKPPRVKWSPPENHPWREQLRAALRLRDAINGSQPPPSTAR
jgi:hypothetical protein